jgi:5'(3')-deoxyribonucleotidase
MKNVALLDLDGVLVKFVQGALKFHNKQIPIEDITWNFDKQVCETPKQFWEPLGYDFWFNLEKTEECDKVVEIVERYFGERVVILSSPCRTKGCAEGKVDWIKKNLPQFERRFFIGQAKSLLAAPTKLLIDDYDKNIDEFEKEGGNAYLFPRPWNKMKDFQHNTLNGLNYVCNDFVNRQYVSGLLHSIT